jgi:hypothetical protein
MGGIGRVKLPVKSRLLRSLVDGQSGSFASDLRLSANLLLLKELRSEDCQRIVSWSVTHYSSLVTADASHCRTSKSNSRDRSCQNSRCRGNRSH